MLRTYSSGNNDHDNHENFLTQLVGETLDYLYCLQFLYVDDIMLVGHRAKHISILLLVRKKESTQYNLKLNYSECTYISMNGKAHIHFSDGQPPKEDNKATCFGEEINKQAGRWSELTDIINIILVTRTKLKTFWYKTNCSH